MKKNALLVLVALAIVACDNSPKQDSSLLAERDSLNQVLEQRELEINDIIGTLNEIEEGFRDISQAENRISVAKDGEGANRKERIKENLQFIQTTMKQNRELIGKLQRQLRESSLQSSELKQTIENLTAQLNEKNKEIEELRAELQSKNIYIAQLDSQISGLNTNVANLTDEGQKKSEVINQQDKELNTAYYAYGTKAELKAQNVLVKKKVLEDNFNKNYFTKIDIRTEKEIKLYSRSAEILTNHPSGSYTLQQDANKQYILRITNPQQFWSTSKYLVVQVK